MNAFTEIQKSTSVFNLPKTQDRMLGMLDNLTSFNKESVTIRGTAEVVA